VQLGGPVPSQAPDTGQAPIAEVVRVSAARHGHRPAITVLRRDRRDEQGFASLLKWTAKGAHLLEVECAAQPGDRVRIVGPAGWPLVTVCLAAWWIGAAITTGADGGSVAEVLHESDEAVGHGQVYAVGDAMDGGPVGDVRREPWPAATQLFPDDPPVPRGGADLVAVLSGGSSLTQAELLVASGRWGREGVLGIDAAAPPEVWLPAVVRPFVTGLATVITDGVPQESAERENVRVWADA
jgi:hypothetical protein